MKFDGKLFLLVCLVVLVGGILFSSGEIEISLEEIFLTLTGKGDPFHHQVLLGLRLPKVLTAILSGGSLALCGLLLQTYFQNPLAGPFVLGIHSGAALFVSIWILLGQAIGLDIDLFNSGMNTILASWLGSLLVMFILFTISIKIPGKVILLVIGLLLGYFSGGIINILVSLARPEEVKTFLIWSMGSFERTSLQDTFILFFILSTSFITSLLIAKPLNLIFINESFAKSLGVNPQKIKILILLMTSILAAAVTSFCGPIAFVGMISPHLSRLLLKTENHRILVPYSVVIGSLLSLLSLFISEHMLPFSVPLNSVLGLLGAPFIIFFLMKKKIGSYS